MRPFLLAATILLFSLTAVFGDTIIIHEKWLQVRDEPDAASHPIDIIYGNDRFDVLAIEGDWYRIRTVRDRVGWIPSRSAYTVVASIANRLLNYADDLRASERHAEARTKYHHIIQNFPGQLQAYEAVRRLLNYYPVAKLGPPVDGAIDPADKENIDRLYSIMLILEGRELIKEERFREAVPVFERARARGLFNRSAMIGIMWALKAEQEDANSAREAEIDKALAYYFPKDGLPDQPMYIDGTGVYPPDPRYNPPDDGGFFGGGDDSDDGGFFGGGDDSDDDGGWFSGGGDDSEEDGGWFSGGGDDSGDEMSGDSEGSMEGEEFFDEEPAENPPPMDDGEDEDSARATAPADGLLAVSPSPNTPAGANRVSEAASPRKAPPARKITGTIPLPPPPPSMAQTEEQAPLSPPPAN